MYQDCPRILLTARDNFDVDDVLSDVVEAIARAELVAGGQVRQHLAAAEGDWVNGNQRGS